LTSLPKPIEAAVNPVSSRSRTAELSLTPTDQAMKVGETRRFALELRSDASMAMAVFALRFDPKVVKVRAVTAGDLLASDKAGKGPSLMQSIDPSGVCLISLSNLNGAAATKGSGTLLFIEIEALAAGDAGFVFDKNAVHLVATDARDVALDVMPVRVTVKQ